MKFYFIKIALYGVSLMIWRRLRVPGTASLAMLHNCIQIINGWDNDHLNQCRIFGNDYGVYHDGGISFNDNAHSVYIDDFEFDVGDKFTYEYNFFEHIVHDIRIEDIKDLPVKNNFIFCISGSGMPGATKHDEVKVQYSILKKIVPIGETENAATIRNHLHNIAKKQEKELEGKPEYISLCQNELDKFPKPGKPITVGIDGGYLKNWKSRNNNFEIIAGKSFSKTQRPKRFGFIQKCDAHPKRRLMNVLVNQGMQPNQQITFLSDGADNVRELQWMMYPESEHILDWFHITMRVTVLNQFAKGLIHSDEKSGKELEKHLESTKWYLWHGNVKKALECIEDCYFTVIDDEIKYRNKKKLIKYVEEFQTYIENNSHLIINYGEKWRYGETISTAFVESTINEVVAKRMVKKQQMQWTHIGAHYLLQTRTAVLNDELHRHFSRWFQGFNITNQNDGLVGMKKTA
jgi:hypothetical protein